MYRQDAEFCVMLVNALCLIIEKLEEQPVEYPKLRQFINGLLDGVKVRLPSGDVVAHPDGSPLHGLKEQLLELQGILDVLELEVELDTTERQAMADTDELRLTEGKSDEEGGGTENGCEEEGEKPL